MNTKLLYGISYEDEIWKPLNFNGTILERYSVSNYGRVFDNALLRPVKFFHQKGLYYHFRVYIGPNEDKNCSVHRAVLMTFNPIPNFKEMQVNHIDGNPMNNELSNLEWCTPMDNTRHAIDTGLYNGVGMANGKARYSDEEVHKICALIDQGFKPPQIADALGHFEQNERNIFCANVRCIKKGKTRTHISKDYNFMKGHDRNIRYSLDFAHLVCQFLSNPNRDFTYKEIMDFLQIPNEERLSFKFYIEDLIKGKTAKSVAEQYNLKKPLDYYEEDIAKYAYLMS